MGADAAPTPRQWQGHSHRALRAMPMQLRKGKQALRLKMRCYVFFFYCFFLRREAQFRINIHCCRGRGASSPTKQSPQIQKPLRQFSKHFKQFFSVFCTCFMPARASFGIKRPAFTRGHGGGVSPHIRSASPANPRSLYARKGITWD